MNQEDRDKIMDLLPKEFQIVDADEDAPLVPGTYCSWADALGHHTDGKGRCRICGYGVTCPFRAFYEAMTSSVIRELDRIGALVPTRVTDETMYPEDMRGPVTYCSHPADRHGPEAGCVECRCIWPRGHHERISQWSPEQTRSEDDLENDPFNLWGKGPSYRCYMTRHRECDPEGADQGCTCACGHQEPVCACATREVDKDGELVHAEGCPAESPAVRFSRDMHAPLSPEVIQRLRQRLADGTAPRRRVKRREPVVYDVIDPIGGTGPVPTPGSDTVVPKQCSASVSGRCLRETQGETGCDAEWECLGSCGWFTGPDGTRRHGVEQVSPGFTDFKPCQGHHDDTA